MTPRTITCDELRRLAARLSGEPFVDEMDFAGCGRYDGGVRCGRPVVETLIPIYGDRPFDLPVCKLHLNEHRAQHLLERVRQDEERAR